MLRFNPHAKETITLSNLSLTSWSLHRSLGPLHMTSWDETTKLHVSDDVEQPSLLELTELPTRASALGITALDICHFHFPSTTPEYLRQLREAFRESTVTFFTLLVDYGDISSADEVRRSADLTLIKQWIDTASAVGAERVRVVAGDADPADHAALQRAAAALCQLDDYAKPRGVRIITENFRSLASTPENCLALYKDCAERVGLIADFGNFRSPQKYDDLSRILPVAESVHAKAHYDEDGLPDVTDFRRCLDLLPAFKYNGPITIVYDGPGDEWAGIARVQAIVAEYL